METKVVSKLFPITRSKHHIRRAVLGTCVVLAADGGARGGAQPRKVTITLSRRRGCWRALSSRGVAVFAFPEASGPISVTAPLDLEYLFRCSGKPDAAAMQIKICVAYCRGAPRKARVSLEEFLEALLDGGRPGSFYLYVYDDKVGLQLASQQFQALPTTWPLEQKPAKGKLAMHTEGNLDAAYNEWQVYLEKVFSMEDDKENTDNDEDTHNEWKVNLEKVFEVEGHEENTGNDDDIYNEWKDYLEKVFSVEDDVGNTDNDDDTHREGKGLPNKVFAVEEDDFNEAAHDVRDAGDVAAAEERQACDVAAAEEGQASDVAAAEQEEASDVPAAEEEQPCDVAATEEEQASDVAAAQEEAPQHAEASRSGTSATDREVSPQVEVHAPVTAVTAAPATVPHAYRSLTVAERFISRLTGPSDRQLEDLRRSHGVSIVRVRRTLHIKGDRDAVLRCHRHIRGEIAEWRRREAAEAQ